VTITPSTSDSRITGVSPVPHGPDAHATFGFTLIEMLTTVAVLVIVLGLMVSLARDVRHRSAEALTTDILSRLDTLVDQYRARALSMVPRRDWEKYPAVHPFIQPAEPLDESQLQDDAAQNNKDLVGTLKKYFDLSGDVFHDLSIANYNEVMVLDSWGRPIVYMPHGHPAIGMAANNRSFFFSAGPDRKYLTRQDNLYSYESATPTRSP
jgi:prepilin-type N-terminal cleavage/methylation domain-containing protein